MGNYAPGTVIRRFVITAHRTGWRHALLALALALSACVSNGYRGIPLRAGTAKPERQQLAIRARVKDKQAQLELGIAFEEGRGVERNFDKARHLYQLASNGNNKSIWIYSPPIDDTKAGRLIRVDRANQQAGLVETRDRREALDGQD